MLGSLEIRDVASNNSAPTRELEGHRDRDDMDPRTRQHLILFYGGRAHQGFPFFL